MSNTVTWHGQEFKLRDKVGIMRLAQLANMANRGMGIADFGAMAALYQLVESVLSAEDMVRFSDVAAEEAVDGAELLEFAGMAIGVISSRPTEVPSSSQSGSESTNESYVVAFSSEESSIPEDLDEELKGLSPIMRDPEVQKFVPVGQSALPS